MTVEDLQEIEIIDRKVQLFPWSYQQLKSSLDAFHQAWIMQQDDTIVAYCIWCEIIDEAELLTIAVSPEYQRKSHGWAMLLFFYEQCKQHNIKKCFLEVAEKNSAALSFYTKQGFVEIGKRKKYYQPGDVTAIIMSLAIE